MNKGSALEKKSENLSCILNRQILQSCSMERMEDMKREKQKRKTDKLSR